MTIGEALQLLNKRERQQANGAEGLTRFEAECVTMRTFSPSPNRNGGERLVDADFLEALMVITRAAILNA